MEDTQKKLDKALKRTVAGNQPPPQAEVASPKTTPTDLPSEEPISESDEADPTDE